MENSVTALVPVFNRLEDTKKCVGSLLSQVGIKIKIIVIDDGSTDGTGEFLAQNYPQVTVLAGDGNLWWTGAISLGLERARRDGASDPKFFILIVNNDVILPADTVHKMLLHHERNPRAIYSAVCVDSSDQDTCIRSGSRMISWFFNYADHPLHGKSLKECRGQGPIPLSMANGRCLLIPGQCFRETGTFNTKKFPHYGGDNEFTIRATRMGWGLFLLPDVPVFLEQSHTGLNPVSRRLSARQVLESLTSIKSANNLKIRARFSWIAVPFYARPTYLIVSYLKILLQCTLTLVGGRVR